MQSWTSLTLATLASCPFAFALGLSVGAFAKDPLGAIAIMKAMLPVWTSLPIVGFVVERQWLWTIAPFANHWGTQAFYDVLRTGAPDIRNIVLAFALGVPVLRATVWFLRRATRLGA